MQWRAVSKWVPCGSVLAQTPAAMVNYKRIVCEVAVLFTLLGLVAAAPTPDCDKSEKHFDQRQNGTENYRLNIDGVVIAVAPAESFLAAASDIDLSDLLDIEDFNELQKPKPPSKPLKPKPDDDKPQDSKPDALNEVNDVKLQKKDASQRNKEKTQRLKYRLANMLLPLLRKNRHH
ncbi:unnamed protein product [Pieris brassicae]|uniref:Uncharacterized protein n=1 Tax=Pieris brassicae TaxID=7116 RepID=A0A9P0XJY5_PIEBR|nr:unnamed protein product [Pieris brassicae]